MPNSLKMIKPCIYYAIGDVHGEAERLYDLHDTILEHHRLIWPDAKQIIVHLGDYVDRGPDSCGAIEAVLELEACASEMLQIVSLRGNHEQLMLDALADPDSATMRTWTRPAYGGQETLESYEVRGIEGELLREKHCQWINERPTIWRPDGTPYVFVHAGVDPVLFPLEEDEIYIWTRSSDFFDTDRWRSSQLTDAIVVHGHTPTKGEPDITDCGRRINVDTGAVFGGPLTCAVLAPDEPGVRFLQV